MKVARGKLNSNNKNVNETTDHTDLILTKEELNSIEWVKNLSADEKRELSLLVLELSLALYHLYSKADE